MYLSSLAWRCSPSLPDYLLGGIFSEAGELLRPISLNLRFRACGFTGLVRIFPLTLDRHPWPVQFVQEGLWADVSHEIQRIRHSSSNQRLFQIAKPSQTARYPRWKQVRRLCWWYGFHPTSSLFYVASGWIMSCLRYRIFDSLVGHRSIASFLPLNHFLPIPQGEYVWKCNYLFLYVDLSFAPAKTCLLERVCPSVCLERVCPSVGT